MHAALPWCQMVCFPGRKHKKHSVLQRSIAACHCVSCPNLPSFTRLSPHAHCCAKGTFALLNGRRTWPATLTDSLAAVFGSYYMSSRIVPVAISAKLHTFPMTAQSHRQQGSLGMWCCRICGPLHEAGTAWRGRTDSRRITQNRWVYGSSQPCAKCPGAWVAMQDSLSQVADNAGLHRSQLLAKMGAPCRQYSKNKSAPLCW